MSGEFSVTELVIFFRPFWFFFFGILRPPAGSGIGLRDSFCGDTACEFNPLAPIIQVIKY